MSVVAKGLVNPWSLAFLPDGSMLVTERPGRLRVIRDGVLDPTPVAGVPAVKAQRLSGLMDVALHPRFAENRFIYLTFSKPREDGMLATALARASLRRPRAERGEGDLRRRAVVERRRRLRLAHRSGATAWHATACLVEKATEGQDTTVHKGKIPRLRDDGLGAPDNPFVGKPASSRKSTAMGTGTRSG